MSRAFAADGEIDFLLISAGAPPVPGDYRHKKLHFEAYRRLRYMAACWAAIITVLSGRQNIIFTRDIVVAFVTIMFGGRAIYEAHKEPMSLVATMLTKLLSGFGTFRLVAISQALATYYQDQYGLAGEQVLVAHDGVFPDLYAPLGQREKGEIRKELGLALGKDIIVHTGSLYKGGAELYGLVCAYDPERILFLHVGGSAEECDEWKAYYTQRNIANIMFIPHVDASTVLKYQTAADLLFYVSTRKSPIYWCTSPLKLFEYMASNVPILGANIGSVAEVIHEDNAFCYDPDQPSTITDALDLFFSNPQEASRRKQNALEDAVGKYSWPKRVRSIIAFAKRPVGGK